MIEYRCPKCAQRMSSPESMVGQVERCPKCKVRIRVPAITVTLPDGLVEFNVDDYFFYWTVLKGDDAAVKVGKSPAGVMVVIGDVAEKAGSVILSPTQAESIAPILARADEYHARFRGKIDATETITLSQGLSVSFHQGADLGFCVEIRLDVQPTPLLVVLRRADAKDFAVPLAQAGAMADFINRKIPF